jgi:hypothetical protein
LFEGFRAGGHGVNGVSLFFQAFGDKALNAGVVFRNEDSHRRMIREIGQALRCEAV